MFSKKNRADRKVIQEIFETCPPNGRTGRFIGGQNLTFKFFLSKTSSVPRISFVIPKTTSKNAVKRNLLRRRGYIVLEKYLNNFPTNLCGVFLFGNKSVKLFGEKNKDCFILLEGEIKNILNKINENKN